MNCRFVLKKDLILLRIRSFSLKEVFYGLTEHGKVYLTLLPEGHHSDLLPYHHPKGLRGCRVHAFLRA